jgi:hypothetical protein
LSYAFFFCAFPLLHALCFGQESQVAYFVVNDPEPPRKHCGEGMRIEGSLSFYSCVLYPEAGMGRKLVEGDVIKVTGYGSALGVFYQSVVVR